MPVIDSRIDPPSDRFQTHHEQMLELIAAFRALGKRSVTRPTPSVNGSMAAGSCFPGSASRCCLTAGRRGCELATLAGYRMHDDDGAEGIQGGGIAGIGSVSGVRCSGLRQRHQGGNLDAHGGQEGSADPTDRHGK